MKKRIQKLLSLMLTLILVVGMVPMTSLPAFAAKDVYTTSVTGIEVTGDGYYIDPNTNECHIKNIDAEMISGTSKFEPDNSGFNSIYTNESCTTRLKTEPELGETYYFNVYVRKADTTNNITNSNSNIKISGFYGGKVLSTETRDDGFFYCVCSIKYGELTGGVKAVASGVAYDSTEGGYAPVFTTLKAVSTEGKELEHIMVDGKYSHYGAKSGCLYKTNLGTSFSDMLTTEPQEGETYYSYFLLDSIDGNLYVEEDLVDIQIPGYDVEYLASYERDMGFTSLVVYKATKVFSTYVGGVGMKDGDYLAVGATKTQTTKPSGGYAYYKNGTLTLNNYSYEGVGYEYISDKDYYAVIYSKNDLTLELVGPNSLKQTASLSEGIRVGIEDTKGKLTIQGDGSLNVTSTYCGILAWGSITVNGGTIISTATDGGGYKSSGIQSVRESVIINGGNVTVSGDYGLWPHYGYCEINGGTVTATGTDRAIEYSSRFTVAENLKIQASTTVDGALGEYVAENHDSYKKIVIKTPAIYVGGVGMNDGDYLAVGATATQTTKPSGGYAYYKNGKLTLNNYSYEGKGYLNSSDYYAVIYTKNDLTLELIGNNTLTQTDSYSDMIYVDDAKLTVGGDGKLTGAPGGFALYADKDITINGGTIEVSTFYSCIRSYGDVIINGGDITAESENNSAINSYYDVTINGGNFTAIGGSKAIDCDSFSVAEGLNIQASTTVDGELGEYVSANRNTYKKIVIKTPDIYVGGVGMCDGDYLAVGATATTATQPSGGYAYYKDGKLTLNNYSYEGKGYEYDSVDDYYATVYAKQDLIVELVGTNTLKQTANDSEAIHVSDSSGSLAIDGSGSLNVTSDFIGIYSAGILTVNDGTIVSTGGYAGIYCYTQDIVINGGNVTASGKLGLHARYGSVEIIGGYVTAIGDESAIAFSYAFNAPEDAAIQASTTADGELGEYVSANHDSYKKIVVCVHRPTPVAAKAATCKDTGNKAYYTCECGKWFEDSTATKEITDKNSVVIPKLTTHTYDNGTITTQPTCKAEGVKTYKCTVCGATKTEAVPVVDHSYVDGKCKYCGIAQPVYHSVYFCFGDSPIASQDIENGKYAIRPEDPYQEGKAFMGWYTKNGEEYDFETPVTGELYLYAKFGYNVFIWLDIDDEDPVAGYTVEEGTIISEPAEPGKENKRFIGWYTDGGTKYDFSKPITGHVNLYARFECIHNYVGGKCEHCGETAPVTITAPANVKVSIVASSGKPKITWNKVEGAVKYEVWRATSSTGKGSRMSSPTTTSLTNNSAKAGTKYYYYVLAVDKDGNKSAASKRVNIVCDYAQPVVTITNDAATGKPKLTWNAVEGATSYKIYRSTSKNGTYSEMKTQSGTSYINTSATVNKTYYYKVKAYGANSAATSADSAVVSRLCDLKRPTVTLSNVASTGKIKVSWTKVTGAAKYQVQRATSKNGTYSVVKTTTSLSYTDTNTTAGKTYYYKVRAVHTNTNANSAYTAYKSRMCDLKAPVVSITTSSGKPKVSWAGITGAKEYKIYRSTSKTGTYKEVKITTAKYWKDTTAVKGKTYYYKVVAVHKNSGANSAYSNVVYKKCTK